MKSIKMRGICAAVTGALLFGFGANAMADSTTDIVNALVAKGVLTEEEGALLNKGREGEAAGQAKALKKAGKVSISDAVDNATIYGDVRARYERRDGTGVDTSNTGAMADKESNRARYKVTMGVKTDAGKWYSDIAVAASSKGSSDNVTLGDTGVTGGSGMSPKNSATVYFKRVMLGWKATDWLTIEAGRMANPLYKVNAMVWDSDIVVEGLNEKLKYKLENGTELFGNFGQWVYDSNYASTNNVTTKSTTTLLAFQGGATVPLIDKKASATGAVSFYKYGGNNNNSTGVSNAASKNFSPFLGSSTSAIRATVDNSSSPNDLAILDIPAQFDYMATESIGTRVYGEYAKNLNGSDRYNKAVLVTPGLATAGKDDDAWLVGFTVASAKDLKSFVGNKMKAGDWSANLWYQSVGAYALDPNTVDSDIFDSRVNFEGTALKLQYNIEDNVMANFTGAWGSRKNDLIGAGGAGGDIGLNLKDLNLYQFDVTYKF